MPIEQNGAVTRGTRQNLLDGLRSAPMPAAAVDAVLEQALQFVEEVTDTYSAEVAAGEVGLGGSGRASDAAILGERPPRALLYGRIQSGKTVGMILTAALCLDNGFRVVVVLTTDNVALVRQTAFRFKNLDGPRVFSAVKEGSSYEWQGQEDQLRSVVAEEGIVLVCAKNSSNLPQVMRFLQQLDASTYPVLVLDDEADAATPDTTIAARSADKPNAPAYASTINRLVMENDRPEQMGFSLGEMFPHSFFVQVTATPYVLLLQKRSAQTRPTSTFLLEPGNGYTGGEAFFGNFDPSPAPERQAETVVVVGDDEAALVRRQVPAGLAQSINFFILSACARASVAGWPVEGFKHLSHTSHKIDDHAMVSGHIDAHLNEIRQVLKSGGDNARGYFAQAYEELTRSVDQCPPIDDLWAAASNAIKQAEVIKVNSKADVLAYGPRLNFVVGGNILGRGLTIDDLLVTYYIREAKTSQMDTVWQHARMYGYRQAYTKYMRVYLPRRLGIRFKQIHEAEEELRGLLRAGRDAEAVLIQVPRSARPTRPNALEEGVVRTVEAGRDQVHPYLLKDDPAASASVLALLRQARVPLVGEERDNRATAIPLATALALVNAVAVDEDDPGLWQPDTVSALLLQFEQELNGSCAVYVRSVQGAPPAEGWSRGRLNGREIDLVRAAAGNAPGLALLFSGDDPDQARAWYPTLVMPRDTPAYVFSAG